MKKVNFIGTNNKGLSTKLKVALAIGIAAVVAGVGYLGYFAWYHAQSDIAREVDYDEFPSEFKSNLESGDTDFIESTSQEFDDIKVTEVSVGQKMSYEMKSGKSDVTITGIHSGTEYSSLIGAEGDTFSVTYNVVIGEEEGWTSDANFVLTATFPEGSYRMETYANVDGQWVNLLSGIATLESGKTYECVAICEAIDLEQDVDIFVYTGNDCECLSVN